MLSIKTKTMQEIFNTLPKIALWISKIIEEKAGTKGKWTINQSGDTQTNLDLLTDVLVEKFLKDIPNVKEIVSEEKEESVILHETWEYLVAYDSLDGSSVSDVDLTIWSIFGIYKHDYSARNLVGAAYILYWPRLEFVVADGEKVVHYKYINGKFIWDVLPQMEEKGIIIAPWSLYRDQLSAHKKFMRRMWKEWYKLRYSGCMVPDVHQIILKWWGMFCYPNTKTHPKGRLRKLYEIFPFTFILAQLGWWGIDHEWNDILSLSYIDVHDPISCYIGSQYEVEKAKKLLAENNKK